LKISKLDDKLQKKILIIGGSGLVGSTLAKYAFSDFGVHITFNQNRIHIDGIQSTRIDLLKNRKSIIKLIEKINPDVVVHTAAHPSVDLCETNPVEADLLHVEVSKDIAGICKVINSKLIYLSTDAIFDGTKQKKYSERDKPNPINHYGKTKLLAEKIILGSASENVILRTAVIYGWHPKSRFSNWIIGTLKQAKIVDPYVDQFNTPTLVDDLVKAILKIINMNISGLFHATGKSCLSRYEFAIKIADIFGYDKKLIKPVTSLEKKQIAPRPKRTCLNSRKLESKINFDFYNISNGISFVFNQPKSSKN